METVYIVESGSIQERVHSPAAYTKKHKNAKEIRVITNDSLLFVAQEIIKIIINRIRILSEIRLKYHKPFDIFEG